MKIKINEIQLDGYILKGQFEIINSDEYDKKYISVPIKFTTKIKIPVQIRNSLSYIME